MFGTPAKSCVNILQEFSVANYRQNPNYVVKDVSPSIHSPRFEVTVEVGKVSCSAQACNKKEAKDICTRKALDELGLSQTSNVAAKSNIEFDVPDCALQETATYNAIGNLNEYTSKNRLPYPIYTDVGTNEKALMITECKLGDVVGHGLGKNKKIAKQNAAAALLKKLIAQKSSIITNAGTPEKVQRLVSNDVDSTTRSACVSPLNKSEEIVDEKKSIEIIGETSLIKNIEEQTIVNPIPETVEKTAENNEILKEKKEEEDMLLEEFNLKLNKLGITNDNCLTIKENVNSLVITYRNEDLNFNIVKISYNLNKTLVDIYDNIKERFDS